MRKVLQEIEDERLRQDKKWGEQNHAPENWNIILDEEIGEFKKELCEAIFEKHDQIKQRRLQKMREELIQTAAVAVAWVESLDRNELKSEFLLEDEREFLEQIKIKGNVVLIICSSLYNHHERILQELVAMGAVQLNSFERHDLETVYGSQIRIWIYDNPRYIDPLNVGCILYLISLSPEDKAIIDSRIKLVPAYEGEKPQCKQSEEQPAKAEPAQTEQFTKKDLKSQKRFNKIADLIDEHAVPISKQMIDDGHLWRYELAMAGNKKYFLSIYAAAFETPHTLTFSRKEVDKAIDLINSFKKPVQDLVNDKEDIATIPEWLAMCLKGALQKQGIPFEVCNLGVNGSIGSYTYYKLAGKDIVFTAREAHSSQLGEIKITINIPELGVLSFIVQNKEQIFKSFVDLLDFLNPNMLHAMNVLQK